MAVLVSKAQQVKPYKAILITNTGKQKGILHKIDSTKVVLYKDGVFEVTPITEIQSIQIRRIKKRFKTKDYIGKMPQGTYTVDRNGQLVDQWGNKAPTLEDEVGRSVFAVFLNGFINVLALPIHALNPNLAKFKFSAQKDQAQLNELSYYSIDYQMQPNALAELKKIKAISAENKAKP